MLRSPTRREWLSGILCTGVAAGLASSTQAALSGPVTLGKLAEQAGRDYGAAVRWEYFRDDSAYRAAILRECSCFTPEIELKWNALEPIHRQYEFGPMDSLLSAAQENGKKTRGHTLLWHKGTPQWAEQALRETKDWRLISDYFGAVLSRYRDAIDQWDVVNEPIEGGYRWDGLRENVFLQTFGPDYITRALFEARYHAPHAKLMINEFGLDYDIPVESDRRYLFLKLLERIKMSGAPLDGIGLQAHLDLSKGPFSEVIFADFLRDIASFGLFIVITEFDVKESHYTLSARQRDMNVATEAARYIAVALADPAVSGIFTWGLSDRYSWLTVTPEDLARFPGAWHTLEGPGFNRGLPLDSSLYKKPLYYTLADTFAKYTPAKRALL